MKFSWLQGAGAAACPQLPLTGAARRGHRLTAHPRGGSARHPHTPLLALDAPALTGPRCRSATSPSQPARLTSALGLARPGYWRIRLKTPGLAYTIPEPP